jgi:transporter family-2 protein
MTFMGLWQFLGLAVFAIAAGASIVFQAAINADMRAALNSASWAALISYLGGSLAMVVFVALSGSPWLSGAAIARTSWLSWTGGLFGAVYVVAAILLLPRLGAATSLALFVTGQMVMSVAIDHFGILGVPQHALDLPRVAGCALLIGGVILIRT